MGERMIVTNPGLPPWSRVGQWYGWEAGPITSKHYAHVTPMRGHFAWQKGWGPQGQQELWASDMFGFHPEADMHWSEEDARRSFCPGPKKTGLWMSLDAALNSSASQHRWHFHPFTLY